MTTITAKYKHQNDTIAIAKGIGIMLVVLGHCSKTYGSMFIFYFVNMFHMPLFFFVSGYFFNMRYVEDKIGFVYKRFKGLYWPFVKFELIFLALHNSFYTLEIYSDKYGFEGHTSVLYGWKEITDIAINIVSFKSGEQLLGAYWFLPVLFFAALLSLFSMWLLSRVTNFNNRQNALILISLFIIAAMLRTNFEVHTWRLDTKTLLASSIYLSGYLVNDYKFNCKYNKLLIISLCFTVVVLSCIFHPTGMLKIEKAWEIPYYFAECSCGIFGTIFFSRYIGKTCIKNLFLFIGQNTLTILTWHFLCFKIVNLIKIQYYGLDSDKLACFPIIFEHNDVSWMALYCITGIFIPLIIPYLKLVINRNNIEQKILSANNEK